MSLSSFFPSIVVRIFLVATGRKLKKGKKTVIKRLKKKKKRRTKYGKRSVMESEKAKKKYIE